MATGTPDPRPSLFRLATRMAGHSGPPTTYDDFLRTLGRYKRLGFLLKLTEASWVAWDSGLDDPLLSTLTRAYSGRVAALAAVECSIGGALDPRSSDVLDVVRAFLRVRDPVSVSGLLDSIAADLLIAAKVASVEDIIPDVGAARRAATLFSLNRMIRGQWLARSGDPDALVRAWWMATQLDRRIATMHSTTRALGMTFPEFARTSMILFALAHSGQPRGLIDVHRNGDGIEVDHDLLRLAAYKLSRDTDDLRNWHDECVLARAPDGFQQYSPNPMGLSPLIDVTSLVDWRSRTRYFLCPSPDQWVLSIGLFARSVVAGSSSQITTSVVAVCGEVLEDYVVMYAGSVVGPGNVNRVSQWESSQARQADLLLHDGDIGLLVEIKRSLALDVEKEVLDAAGIASVIQKIYGAYGQCQETAQRAPWKCEPALRSVEAIAAIVLIDESMAAEGGMLSVIVHERGLGTLPLEVMNISEFEDAVAVLGVRTLASAIRDKWTTEHRDLPLRVYATHVLAMERQQVPGAKVCLRPSEEELLGNFARGNDDEYSAGWPA